MRVSVSQVKMFKACRRAWFFMYREKLDPVKKSDALETGTNYHAKIEQLYKDGMVDVSEPTKETAMALAYGKYIFPNLKAKAVEEWHEKNLNGITLCGKVDGMTEDGIVIEHKTTSRDLGAEYEYNLLWDEQVLAYMYLTDTRRIIYTVCRKPTIRQKKDETQEEFFSRMCAWYDEDTETKIRCFDVIRTDEEISAWADEFFNTVLQMQNTPVYRNTLHCQSFGVECPYKSICLGYDPAQEYVDFVRRDD